MQHSRPPLRTMNGEPLSPPSRRSRQRPATDPNTSPYKENQQLLATKRAANTSPERSHKLQLLHNDTYSACVTTLADGVMFPHYTYHTVRPEPQRGIVTRGSKRCRYRGPLAVDAFYRGAKDHGLNRGHLTPVGDFTRQSDRDRTMDYERNIVPNTRTVNDGNLNVVERNIRALADRTNLPVRVCSGWIGTQGATPQDQGVTLPVPRFLYKLVIDEPAVAIVVCNDPAVSEDDFVLPRTVHTELMAGVRNSIREGDSYRGVTRALPIPDFRAWCQAESPDTPLPDIENMTAPLGVKFKFDDNNNNIQDQNDSHKEHTNYFFGL